MVFANKEQEVDEITRSGVARNSNYPSWNDVVTVMSEGRKHLLPLAIIATGSIWLSALAFQWTIAPGVVWVLCGDYDFGKVPQGKIIEHLVHLFNPRTYPIHLQFETGRGCTVVAEEGTNLSDLRLDPFSWHTVSIRVATAGLEAGQHLQVVWIKVRENDKIHLQPIWLGFSLQSLGR